jgi:hypothetical protein
MPRLRKMTDFLATSLLRIVFRFAEAGGDYAVRRNNLHNLAGHSYTGQQGIYDIVTHLEIEEIDLCI